jgi:hypothetical protein
MPVTTIEHANREAAKRLAAKSRRREAEALWEEIDGLCICQRAEVRHWCESCQLRIDIIQAALKAAYERDR